MYALYVVVSQCAVLGIHYSVLHYISQRTRYPRQEKTILWAALSVTAVWGSFIGGGLYALAPLIAGAIDSPGCIPGIQSVSAAVLLLALNKCLLATLNGYNAMKTFALFQGARAILLFLCLVGMIVLHTSGLLLPLCFSVTEAMLHIGLLIVVGARVRHTQVTIADLLQWIKRHVSFGVKGCLGGIAYEVHTRVDLLMIGFFMSDRAVGIYSIASMLAEGLQQIPFILRQNIDPTLGTQLSSKDHQGMQRIMRDARPVFYGVFGGIVVVTIGLFYAGATLFLPASYAVQCGNVFLAIALGVLFSIGFRPFHGIFNQSGHPGRYSLFLLTLISVNIALNFLLIPILGIMGAATATLIAFLVEGCIFTAMVRAIVPIRG